LVGEPSLEGRNVARRALAISRVMSGGTGFVGCRWRTALQAIWRAGLVRTGVNIMKGFGVQVTLPDEPTGPGQVLPMVVVARDESDAELVASAAAGGRRTQAQVLRELSEDEAFTYGLDLGRHGDVKTLPVLDL